MTDFHDHPGRPEHPDFWGLSDAILRIDGAATEGGKDVASVLQEYVNIDPESVSYVAVQRAVRICDISGIGKGGSYPEQIRTQSTVGGAWLDGFTVGALFESNRATAVVERTNEMATKLQPFLDAMNKHQAFRERIQVALEEVRAIQQSDGAGDLTEFDALRRLADVIDAG